MKKSELYRMAALSVMEDERIEPHKRLEIIGELLTREKVERLCESKEKEDEE